MKKLILLAFVFFSHQVYAVGGYSSWAIPTQLEYVNQGVLIYGAFGNPGACVVADAIFVSQTNVGNENFSAMLSMIMTAFTAKKEMRFRTDHCFDVTSHGLNVSESRTAVYIK